MKNVVLVTVDCLRYDHLQYMERLMGRQGAASFTRFFSNAPFTGYSISSLLTSLYPPIETRVPTLAKVFQRHGFATAAFVPNAMMLKKEFRWILGSFGHTRNYITDGKVKRAGNVGASWLDDLASVMLKKYASFLPQRFDVGKIVDAISHIYFPSIYSKNISDEAVIRDALRWIDGVSQPFFTWIHLMDAHNPYVPSDFDTFSEKEINKINFKLAMKIKEEWGYPVRCDISSDIHAIRWLYRRAVEHIDEILDDFIEKLASDTVVIITADHGEQFLEHGGIQHMFWRMYEEQIHIPCVMFNASGDADVDGLHSLVDLFPTILDTLDLDHPLSIGRSVFREPESGSVVIVGTHDGTPVYGIRTERWKLVQEVNGQWTLFDLENDALEGHNVIADHKDVAKELHRELKHRLKENYITVREMRDIGTMGKKIKDRLI